MIYHTGSRDDWDYISRITRDPSWAWDAMARHRDLNQKYVAPSDGHDDVRQERASPLLLYSYRSSQTNQYLPSAHSRNGTLSVSLPGYTYPGDSRVIAATAEPDFVSEFPFQRDPNAGNSVRLITILMSSLFLPAFVSENRSALAGYRAPLPMASAPARPPATLDRNTSIARTYISCFTPMLRSFLRPPILVPRLLHSMVLSSEPDPLVSQQIPPLPSPRSRGIRSKVAGDSPQGGHSECGGDQHSAASDALWDRRSS